MLERALAGEGPESDPPSWTSIAIDADWILHPALLCSLERVKATLRPVASGVGLELDHGVWAGIPLRGSGRYTAGDAPAVALEVALGPPWEPVGPYPSAGPWAQGRYRAGIGRFGPWRTRQAVGEFQAQGSRVSLVASRLDLDPGGRLEGRYELDFSRADGLPWRLGLQVPPLELSDLSASLGRDPAELEGRLAGAVDLTGTIRPGHSSLADAEGMLSLHARNGVVRRELPPLLAIAMASERLSPFPARESIRFDAIDLVATVEAGRARAQAASLESPSLRMVAAGELGLARPNPLHATVGVLFFRRLDSVIQRLPILSQVLLGPDENLVNAYFALEGPWDGPEARLVPMKTLAAGPASFVLEGLPSLVRGGFSRLRAVLPDVVPPGDGPTDAPPESPLRAES